MLSIVGSKVSLSAQTPTMVNGVEEISMVLPIGSSSPNRSLALVSSKTATCLNFLLSSSVMPLPFLIVNPAIEK